MNTCSTCKYHRPPGYMDAGIYGHGSWCSNSKSKEFRTRTKGSETCRQWTDKSNAPLWMRKLIKAMEWLLK